MRVWVIPFTVHLKLPQHCFLCVCGHLFLFSLFFLFYGIFCFSLFSFFIFITTLSTGYTPYKIKRLKKKSPFSPVEHPFSDTSRVPVEAQLKTFFSALYSGLYLPKDMMIPP